MVVLRRQAVSWAVRMLCTDLIAQALLGNIKKQDGDAEVGKHLCLCIVPVLYGYSLCV